MIRRVMIIVSMALVLFTMSSCVPYENRFCPIEYENTRWTCEELDIYFDVNEKFKDITWCRTYGQVNLNSEITEVRVSFDYGTGVEFSPISACVTKTSEDGLTRKYIDGDMWLFLGRCKFNPNKCVVTIFNNEKGFLDDSVKTLTFIKGDIPEDAFVPDAADIPEVVLIPEDIPQPESPPVHTDMI